MFGAVLLVGVWLGTTGRGQQPQLPQLDVPQPHQAVFVDDPNFGKDPFFPHSKRRVAKLAVRVDPQPVADGLVLKGLSGTPEERLAIINNETFAVGEEGDVRVGDNSVKLRCVEIRELSVIINIGGINRELRLRSELK